MHLAGDIRRLVGHTPMTELKRVMGRERTSARLLAKLESFNPTGSVKDRAALFMLDAAEREGKLLPGATIIEPTSGNTGISLAALAAPRGYRVVLTMPDTMSQERRKLLRAYGAELVLTEGAGGMKSAIRKAETLAKEIPGSFMPAQFDNPHNARAHYLTTGPEIFSDTQGRVDCLIAGVGTGGTISGTGQYLRECNPAICIIAVEPLNSPVLSGGAPGPHKIQGIGAGFIPAVLDTEMYHEIIAVDNEDAIRYARSVASLEGLLAGISSGAALCAAVQWAKRPDNTGKTAVVLFPDGGNRYLSTSLFAP